ncbi:DUF3800 domain-containing protein [Candidatus Marsarchaeota archaeon]|nr:DUF3800 domain-containing protein [Candidatus Marsarchaeota archaeon]
MVKYIFIDESGDLGLNFRSSRYLVLAALIIDEPKKLDRIIRNMRRNKFKRELKGASEIKANSSSTEVRLHLLKQLEPTNGRVVYMILEKKRVYSEYLQKNKDKLYNFVAGRLARNMNIPDGQIIVRIDKSKGKQLLQQDFNQYFESSLNEIDIHDVKIFHSDSASWSGLQIADMLAWSCFQRYEYSNSTYVNAVKLSQEFYEVWEKNRNRTKST